jgi:hypothetical protein
VAANGATAPNRAAFKPAGVMTQSEIHTAPLAPSRLAFAFIFITVLLDMLALGIVIPVLPPLIVGFMGGDTAGGADIRGLE